jgi:hypothetical protein
MQLAQVVAMKRGSKDIEHKTRVSRSLAETIEVRGLFDCFI